MQIILSKRDKVVTGITIALLIGGAALYTGDKYQPVKVAKDVVNYTSERVNQQVNQANAEQPAKTAHLAKTSVTVSKAQTPKASNAAAPLPQMHGQHTVAKGETLWSIARANNVPPTELLAANGMNRDTKLYPGQMVTIPSK